MIPYTKVTVSLHFSTPIIFEEPPSCILRGILGAHLRRSACAMDEKQSCAHCMLRNNCAYAWFFESHIPQDNGVLSGRNRASHPFTLYCETPGEEAVTTLDLEVTLFGRGIEFLPYIFLALKKGGEQGFGKKRISFHIEDVLYNGESLIDGNTLKAPEIHEFRVAKSESSAKRDILLKTQSTLRIQADSKFVGTLGYETLLKTCARRVRLLEGFYGTPELPDMRTFGDEIYRKKCIADFKDLSISRYSGRQKRTHDMSGITGTLELSGTFTELELSLLKAGELFHIGKNTGFGLGRYQLWGI